MLHSCILCSFYPWPVIANLLAVVSIMFFWRPKERKAPAHGTYQSVVALFESCLWQHFSVTSNLVTKVFSFAFWVLRNDRASEYNASLLANCKRAQPVVGEANLTSVQTVLALFPKSKRPFVVLLTVPDLFKKLLLLWFLLTFTISFSYSVNNSLSGVLLDNCALSF